MGKITVVGLGNNARQMTFEAAEALQNASRRILRTARHDAANWLVERELPFSSLDELYEQTDDFDRLNDIAAETVIRAAREEDVVYAVPGAADLTDATVRTLALRGAIDRVIGGVSQDTALLGGVLEQGLPSAQGRWQRCCAREIDEWEPDVSMALLIVEVDSRLAAGEVKTRLLEYYPDEQPCFVLTRGKTRRCMLYELDYDDAFDHTTSVFVAPVADPAALSRFGFAQLCWVMDRLRAPDGCPWDGAQDHHSLEQYLIEEAYEALDAIRREDAAASVEELGDLLLQIVFHAAIGAQFDEYDIRDITTEICEKMIRRHPKLFSPNNAPKTWEELKREEKGFDHVSQTLLDVPRAMPSPLRAQKLQKRSKLFDGVTRDEECAALERTLQSADEPSLAYAAFLLCNAARRADVNLEMALAKLCDAFCEYYTAAEEKGDIPTLDAFRKTIFV